MFYFSVHGFFFLSPSILLLSTLTKLFFFFSPSFLFGYWIFQFQNVHLVLLYNLYFFAETFSLFICFKCVAVAYWSIVWWLLLNLHQIILTSLTSWVWHLFLSFFLQCEVFLAIGMTSNLLPKPGYFSYYVMRLWILFKCFVLAGFLWHWSSRGREVLPHYGKAGFDIQVPHSASILVISGFHN